MKTSILKLSDLFPGWRKAEWPRSTGPHNPLAGEEMPNAERAASQEWEDEGGAVKPAAAPGPKIPL